MYHLLSQVYKHPNLTAADIDQIIAAHDEILMSKHDYMLKKGQIPNGYYIVKSGLLRSYVLDNDGKEITTDFFTAGSIVIEVAGLFQQQPTVEFIQSLTDAELYFIDFDIFQKLFVTIPAFAEWGRSWMAQALIAYKSRMLDMVLQTAQERYKMLINTHQEIIKYAPVKHIATYLGITDTSLSRIRKELSK